MKEEIKVDAKRLIAEVYKRSALWNQKDILYHNRDVTNQIWTELSALLGLPKAVLKTKWKGLRDTFRAEIKKEQVYHKSKYPRSKSVWIHYKRLQFLKEQMLPRPPIWERENCNDRLQNNNECETISSAKSGQSTRNRMRIMSGKKNIQCSGKKTIACKNSSILDNDNCRKNVKSDYKKLSKSKSSLSGSHQLNKSHIDNNSTVIETTQNNSINSALSNEQPTMTIKDEPLEELTGNIECNNVISSGLSNENEMMLQTVSAEQVLMTNIISENCDTHRTIDPLEGNRFDDNYYFLMSLLPHIKTLPAERRMLLRMQMQELVYEEVYKKNHSINSLSS